VNPAYFDRQGLIAGWRQDAFMRARVLVEGRDWPSRFTVWGLAGLGIGEISWLGSASSTSAFEDFLGRRHAEALGVALGQYPFDPVSAVELAWIFSGAQVSAIVGTSPLLNEEATRLRIPIVGLPAVCCYPPLAMLAAALGIDEVRQVLNPLTELDDRERGTYDLPVPGHRRGRVVLVGVGGIGVYCATVLAAAGVPQVLIDRDDVEMTNLNRQGLFTADDAEQGRPKALAAARRLRNLFSGVEISGRVAEITLLSASVLASCEPHVIVSAVDNAATRLAISEIGRSLRLAVVHAGTDVFAADCFTQIPGGPLLDEQMSGALSRAAAIEAQRRPGSCSAAPSYVVPSMVAGAFAAHRVLDVVNSGRSVASLHWRSGLLPRARNEFRDEFSATTFRNGSAGDG
jgi:hypothetical protein